MLVRDFFFLVTLFFFRVELHFNINRVKFSVKISQESTNDFTLEISFGLRITYSTC